MADTPYNRVIWPHLGSFLDHPIVCQLCAKVVQNVTFGCNLGEFGVPKVGILGPFWGGFGPLSGP